MGTGDAELTLDGVPGAVKDQVEAGLQQHKDEASKEIRDNASIPGVWTIVFGLLAAVGAVLLLIRRFPGIGALVVTVAGLAATIAVIVFVSDPASAVGMKSDGDFPPDADVSTGFGLWLALLGALLGLLAGVAAVLLNLMPDKFDDAKPAAPGQFGGRPQGGPQQFGAPQQGYQQPGHPQQGGYPPQPGYPQQGFGPQSGGPQG
ncbi:MAG: hypothetical protein QM658_01135 [Gordonia sp. (in: high G+C Gram-positive bacteria)]